MSNVLTIVGNFPIKGVLNCAKKNGKNGSKSDNVRNLKQYHA